jgi:hypothetical protein
MKQRGNILPERANDNKRKIYGELRAKFVALLGTVSFPWDQGFQTHVPVQKIVRASFPGFKWLQFEVGSRRPQITLEGFLQFSSVFGKLSNSEENG